MRKPTRVLLAAPAALALTLAAMAPAASAEESFEFELTDTMDNDSGSEATAVVEVDGDEMTVKIDGSGFTPEMPHAQHFHGSFSEDKNFICPDSSADKDDDGQVNTEEGLPDYGDIVISLTTKGDTSPDSGLAVDRMPVADADGDLSYERTITLPDGAGDKLKNLHIVQHGLDENGNDKYDLDALGESSFAKSKGVDGLPEEATNPATCGTISGSGGVSTGGSSDGDGDNGGGHGGGHGGGVDEQNVPAGGVETGAGSTTGVESPALFALSGLAGTAAIGALALRRHPRAGGSEH